MLIQQVTGKKILVSMDSSASCIWHSKNGVSKNGVGVKCRSKMGSDPILLRHFTPTPRLSYSDPKTLLLRPQDSLTPTPRLSYSDPKTLLLRPQDSLTPTPRLSYSDPKTLLLRPQDSLTPTPRLSYSDPKTLLLRPQDSLTPTPRLSYSDPKTLILTALNNIARAKGISRLAENAGMTRQGLYKALSSEGNPSFATVVKITKALGVELRVHVAG